MSVLQQNYVKVDGRTLPRVDSILDPYRVRTATHNVRDWHLDCQPRVEPTKLYEKRMQFFENLFARVETPTPVEMGDYPA